MPLSVQEPNPSQVSWFVCRVPEHARLLPQAVPMVEAWQALAPLHCPVMQVAVAHSLPGSVPAAMPPHTPSAPVPLRAAVQASHRPLHALLQQTPSTQKPLAQSDGPAHAKPSIWAGTHWFELQ